MTIQLQQLSNVVSSRKKNIFVSIATRGKKGYFLAQAVERMFPGMNGPDALNSALEMIAQQNKAMAKAWNEAVEIAEAEDSEWREVEDAEEEEVPEEAAPAEETEDDAPAEDTEEETTEDPETPATE